MISTAKSYRLLKDKDAAQPDSIMAASGSIGIFFAVVAAGLLCATLAGAATAWDGSYSLFKILQTDTPFITHNRLFVMPLHYVVIFAARMTDSSRIVQSVFTLSYAILPFLALAGSWWVVRRDTPELFVWAALGIGIGTLPGQFSFTNEANIAVQFSWPITLAILTRLKRHQIPVVLVASLIVFFSHPIAIVIFLFAACLAILVGWQERSRRRYLWSWAALYGIAYVIATSLFFVSEASSTLQPFSLEAVQKTFFASIVGFPLIAFLCVSVAAILVGIAPRLARLRLKRLLLLSYTFEFICIVTTGMLLLFWASDSYWWRGIGDFQAWGMVVSIPFIVLAVFEGIIQYPTLTQPVRTNWNHRIRTIQIIGLICTLVLVAQSISWLSITNRLEQSMAESKSACISTSNLRWLGRTPLDHWSITAYSLLLQGPEPQKIVLNNTACKDSSFATGIPIAPGETISKTEQTGWFDLQPLAQRLTAKRQ